MIRLGKMTAAGSARIEEARGNGRWDAAYTSRVAPSVPDDLQEALNLSPEAAAGFSAWTNSAQTMYVVWVEEAKRPETRRRRIAELIRRARQPAETSGGERA
jgi:uncharacterized protein YdeI (YjbR/CyaY-like superfamily)